MSENKKYFLKRFAGQLVGAVIGAVLYSLVTGNVFQSPLDYFIIAVFYLIFINLFSIIFDGALNSRRNRLEKKKIEKELQEKSLKVKVRD